MSRQNERNSFLGKDDYGYLKDRIESGEFTNDDADLLRWHIVNNPKARLLMAELTHELSKKVTEDHITLPISVSAAGENIYALKPNGND